MRRLTLTRLPPCASMRDAFYYIDRIGGEVVNVKVMHCADGTIRCSALVAEKRDFGPNDANLKNAAIQRLDISPAGTA